jgi:hypothetical protein
MGLNIEWGDNRRPRSRQVEVVDENSLADMPHCDIEVLCLTATAQRLLEDMAHTCHY